MRTILKGAMGAAIATGLSLSRGCRAWQAHFNYCINTPTVFVYMYWSEAMHHAYRQNYVPSRPLPRWLQRLIYWL